MNKTRHTISPDDVMSVVNTPVHHEIASSAGGGSSKRIIVSVNLLTNEVTYEVINQRKLAGSYGKVIEAVAHYNKLP